MDEVKPAAWRYKALSAPDEPWQAAIRRPASGWPAEPLYTAEQIRAAVLAERERCARLVEPPADMVAWEVRGGEEGIELMGELAAAIRQGK